MAEDALVFQLAGDVRPGASMELVQRVPVACTLTHLDVRPLSKARLVVRAVRTNPIRSTRSLAMLAGDEFVITIECLPGNDTEPVRVTVAATATMRS